MTITAEEARDISTNVQYLLHRKKREEVFDSILDRSKSGGTMTFFEPYEIHESLIEELKSKGFEVELVSIMGKLMISWSSS